MSVDDAIRELASAGEADLGRLLLRAFRTVNATVVGRLATLGHEAVRAPHAVVFMHLDAAGTRMTTLAQRSGMSRQATSGLVRELQTAGYVRVEPDPVDGRASRVTLTEKGVHFCLQASEAVRDLELQWQRILGPAGLDQIRASLRLLGQQDVPRSSSEARPHQTDLG